MAWPCSLCSVFLSSRFSSWAQSGLAKPHAELRAKCKVMPSSTWDNLPASAVQTSCAVLCYAMPGQPRASGQGWMLPRVSMLPWVRREITLAKVVSSRGSRNNSCEQEVISQGKRFNGSVTWHCRKTQPRAAAASWGGCRRCVGGRAVPCRAVPGAPTAELGVAAAPPALSRWLKVVLF